MLVCHILLKFYLIISFLFRELVPYLDISSLTKEREIIMYMSHKPSFSEVSCDKSPQLNPKDEKEMEFQKMMLLTLQQTFCRVVAAFWLQIFGVNL